LLAVTIFKSPPPVSRAATAGEDPVNAWGDVLHRREYLGSYRFLTGFNPLL